MHTKISFANLSNLPLIEELYQKYLTEPDTIDHSWRCFFEGMQFGSAPFSLLKEDQSPDLRIYHLIESYRIYGHLLADFNPIIKKKKEEILELSLAKQGLQKEDLTRSFPTCGFLKSESAPLQTIIRTLEATYCGKVGIEYMGMVEPDLEKWIQKRIEPHLQWNLKSEEKLDIWHYLNKAELFESFLHTKYVGQKRFSLEGEESFIPLLAQIIQTGTQEGVEEVFLGMSHRGRLNVLANILNKSYAHIFHEFEDFYTQDLLEGTGDVKYHKGFEGSFSLKSGQKIKISLVANPSHLESVDPVVQGEVRGIQQYKKVKKQILPILVHGDAAIAGQGVVYETLELARLTGYSTGGTIHIVINNQIGFTTLPKDARSTRYCTDIAKTVGAPVFHVNAEDPEGCVAVAKIAIEIRQKFQCDVFIDLNGYRKYGHNESDEPGFTQPLQYGIIRKKKTICELYRNQLIQEGVLDLQSAEAIENEFKKKLHSILESVKSEPSAPKTASATKRELKAPINTGVEASRLREVAASFCKVPEGFHLHPKLERHIKERLTRVQSETHLPVIDWGIGEHLAYATLLYEGIHIRLSGQDSRRGTFSHRHAMWVDQVDAHPYFPLSHLTPSQAPFDVFNSPLSEFAVLGFDFGYSLTYPHSLVIWEAQFGDFCNGAQIIIDQYIATSEQKWGQRSNITLKLPHGYEGQGPEHSSARIERFLQLCGDQNMQIVNATTPAQLFHLLRRQSLSPIKIPLIIFTPKAFLRHPLCVSPLDDFTKGSFKEVLDDPKPPVNPKRLLFCTGKIYYDLLSERQERQATHLAIVRIEQLYPLNLQEIEKIIEAYKGCEQWIWVQEEHKNMGGWSYIEPIFKEHFKIELRYIGRACGASPAAGSHTLHKQQQVALMEETFKGI